MSKSEPLPNPQAVQLQALAPFITPKALKLAAERLEMTDEKVALLIAKAVNPHLILTQEEEALLRGVTPKTLSGYWRDKLWPRI